MPKGSTQESRSNADSVLSEFEAAEEHFLQNVGNLLFLRRFWVILNKNSKSSNFTKFSTQFVRFVQTLADTGKVQNSREPPEKIIFLKHSEGNFHFFHPKIMSFFTMCQNCLRELDEVHKASS